MLLMVKDGAHCRSLVRLLRNNLGFLPTPLPLDSLLFQAFCPSPLRITLPAFSMIQPALESPLPVRGEMF